jgi:hypothetical protein
MAKINNNPFVETIQFLVQLLTIKMKVVHYGFLVSLFVAYWAIHVEMQSNLKKANDNHVETKDTLAIAVQDIKRGQDSLAALFIRYIANEDARKQEMDKLRNKSKPVHFDNPK